MNKIYLIIIFICSNSIIFCQNKFYEDGSYKEVIRYDKDSSVTFWGAYWKDTLREFANFSHGRQVGESIRFFFPVSEKNHIIYEYYDNNGNCIYHKAINYTTHQIEKESYAELLDENMKLKNVNFEIVFWYSIKYHPNGKMASKGHYIIMPVDTFELIGHDFPSSDIKPYGIHYDYDTNGVYLGKRYIPKSNTIKYTIRTYDENGVEYYNTYSELLVLKCNAKENDNIYKTWDKNEKLTNTYEVDPKGNQIYREWNGKDKLLKTEKYDKNGFEIK